MRRQLALFLRGALLFLGVVVMLVAAIVRWGPPITRNTYMDELAVKHARLGSLPSPRIIIVGGSNALFGIDSERLGNAFHRNVVNMALHASLGYGFMVNEVIGDVRAGDVVLLVPEHSQYARPRKLQDILYVAIDKYPRAMHYVPPSDRPRAALNYSVRKVQAAWRGLVKRRRQNEDPVYHLGAFNAAGDMVGHIGRPAPGPQAGGSKPLVHVGVDPAFEAITADIAAHARAVGATVILCWPSHAASYSAPSLCEDLERATRNGPVPTAGKPQDYVFADSLFFDTPYHLTGIGRELRTERLIADLQGLVPAP